MRDVACLLRQPTRLPAQRPDVVSCETHYTVKRKDGVGLHLKLSARYYGFRRRYGTHTIGPVDPMRYS